MPSDFICLIFSGSMLGHPSLRVGDPFKLALTPQIGFKFGEHAQHVEETLACRRAGVDWLHSGL
jgi:hypothetical protein